MTDYRDTIGKSEDEQTGGIWDDATDVVNDGVDAVSDTVDDTAQTIDDTVQNTQDEGGVLGQAGDFVDNTVEDVEETVDDSFDSVAGAAEETGDFFAGEGATGDAFDDATDAFDDATETVDDAFSGAQDAFEETTNSIDETFADAGDTFDDATDDLQSFGEDAFDGATETVEGAFDGATDFAGNVGNTVENLGGGAFDTITDLGDGAIDAATNFAEGAANTAGDLTDGALDFGGDVVDTTVDTALGTVDFGTDVVGETIDTGVSLGEQAADEATGQDDQNPEVQWGELTEVEQMGQCVIHKQDSNQGDTRYVTVTANSNGDAVAVASDGSFTVMSNVSTMSEIPWHDTLQAARDACNAADLPTQWGSLEQAETYNGGVILSQSSQSGDTRYFALVPGRNGANLAVATDGSTAEVGDNVKPEDLPSYPNIEAARSALDKHGGPSRQWGQLQKIGTEGQCAIMAQASSDGNRRFFTFTKADNGELVAMANDGSGVVISSVENAQQLPHYPTESDARKACPSNPETPTQGGDNGPTDDSTSSDGPESSGGVERTENVSEREGGSPPDVDGSEVSSGSNGPLGAGPSGIMDMKIAGLPLPIIATAGAGAIGLVSSALGGNDSKTTKRRKTGTKSRTSRRSNVTRRKGKNKKNNSGNKGNK